MRDPRTFVLPLLLPLLLALLVLAGCSVRRQAWELGLGSFATDLAVTQVNARGPYIDAVLEGHGLTLEVLAPDTEDCRFVFTAEEQVDYRERGIGGHYKREGRTCVAAGGSLRLVGERQPRGAGLPETGPARSQATFSVLHMDDELLLLRGRFPEASRIGWSELNDTVVGLPNIPVCRKAIEGGVASMEYRAGHRNRLALVGGQGLCPIALIARPVPAIRAAGG